jgi:hypothetical protein
MRLLNTTTLRVEKVKREIVANEKPPLKYPILSHTWGEDEVVFQDEIRAAALKSSLDGPLQAPGPTLDFALISYARLLG